MPYYHYFLAFVLAGLASSFPQSSLLSKRAFTGLATFNDFTSQVSTVCGPKSGIPGTFGAAASSVSPNLAPGACDSKIDTSLCSGQAPKASYAGPSCSKSNCGICYNVTNIDGGNTVTVQIIDSCPATSAFNYCKTNIPANQRCGDGTTDQLDIDQAAYLGLTGVATGPNIKISIVPVTCPGVPGAPPVPPPPVNPPPAPAPPPSTPPANPAPAPAPAPAKAPPPPEKLPLVHALPPAKQNPPPPLNPPPPPPVNKTLPHPAPAPKAKVPPAPGRVMMVWQNGTKAWGPGS